jgi:hypothetical protein
MGVPVPPATWRLLILAMEGGSGGEWRHPPTRVSSEGGCGGGPGVSRGVINI